jgi:outer membrane protein
LENRMIATIISLMLSVLMSVNGYTANFLTREDAIATALKNHPQAIEARENLHEAEARTGQAFANYYPQISIVSDWSKGRFFLTPLERIKDTEVQTNALYLQQTIYDFGRTAGSVEMARWNKVAAVSALNITRQDIIFRVQNTFYLVLAAEKQVVATKKTVAAREEVFLQAQEFFNQGIRSKADMVRAEASLYEAKTSLIRAENNQDIARVELSNAMGISTAETRLLAESDSIPVALPEQNKVQQEAFTNRAELKRFKALKNSAAATIKTVKSGYLPVLSGMASTGYADEDFLPSGNVWAVGLNLTVPIFTGFTTKEQVKEATAALRAIEAQESNEKLLIMKEVDSAWLGVRESTARITSTDKEVAAAKENLMLVSERYQEGVGSIIEVTDAQSQALDAETAYIQAIYDYHTALARLDRAVGKDDK